jgi:hypothetical protein
MANVPVVISRTIIERPNGLVSSPPATDFTPNPLNPDGISQIPPVHLAYTSEANMIAGQSNQIANFIYFDGSFYWEYLGELSATDVRTLLNVANGADAYVSWVLAVTGTAGTQSVTSGSTVTVTGTAPITAVRSGATITLSHAVSGVTAGTYNNVTVNTLGHVTAGSNVGYITGNQTINLSGDVTGSGATSITATIANQAVTYAKIQNVTADRLLGRITTTGTAQELTATQVRTLLNVADGATANVGTVTNIATNNGITGGPITGTGTIGLTGQALALHNLATNGLIARTGAGTVAGRTITGSTSISVTNGNGVSGNPTLSAIFGTTAGTVAEGSALGNFVLKAGDTMTGNLSFNSVADRSLVFDLGARVRAASGAFVISSETGTSNNIILRPNGDTATTGQMRVNSDGTVEIGSQATATNHAVLGGRNITAGTGLTGGGNLTADRTLTVSFGTTAGTVAQGNDSRIVNAVPNTRTLNGLALSSNQTFATGTTGTDFGISSSGTTHTFNIPTASASNRGLLSSANWTTFNNKIGGSGTAGRVTIYDGTSSISSNSRFTFDNTNGLFVGATRINGTADNVTSIIELGGSTNNIIRSTGLLRIDTNGSNERVRITTDGDLYVNRTTADASGGKVQVNGTITTNSTLITADPDAGARHPWKLGRASGFLDTPPDPQLTIRVEINGVKYDLLAVSV